MTTIAPLAKPAAVAKKPDIPVAKTLGGNTDFKTSLTQIPSENARSGNNVDDSLQTEDRGSLNILMAIVLGILSSALLAAVLTIVLSS